MDVEIWHVVVDISGHHRAISGLCPEDEYEWTVGAYDSYLEACSEADKLNQVSGVLES